MYVSRRREENDGGKTAYLMTAQRLVEAKSSGAVAAVAVARSRKTAADRPVVVANLSYSGYAIGSRM